MAVPGAFGARGSWVFAALAALVARLDLAAILRGFRVEKFEPPAQATWHGVPRSNLRSAVACKASRAHLAKYGNGRIISLDALDAKASAGMGAYAGSKAGVARLTETLADELKNRCVTVNALLCGSIDTPRDRFDAPKTGCSGWVAASFAGGA